MIAPAQLLSPPSSFRTRSMSSSASRIRISKGASVSFASCLRRGRKMIPPSPGPYDRLMNSGRPSRLSFPKSVPGMPQRKSAPKFSHDVTYISDPKHKARAHSVSVICLIDLKKARWRDIQSLLTSRMVPLIFLMTGKIVPCVILSSPR